VKACSERSKTCGGDWDEGRVARGAVLAYDHGVSRRSTLFAVVALGLVTSILVAGCGGGSTTTIVETTTTKASPTSQSTAGFTEIPTVKCKTSEGVHRPAARLEATTPVAVPSALAKELAAYRDTEGTMVIAPEGFECEAGIGVDGSQTVFAFPKGAGTPLEDESATVVGLSIIPACEGCMAELACTFFPEAKAVTSYPELKCPEKPLREEVFYPATSTALFADPSQVKGSGLGSGGTDPSFGAISYSEPGGVRKLSCTLPPEDSELCKAIVGATFAVTD
jgi:hypothetical protein